MDKNNGMCQGVVITFLELKVIEDFLLLELGSTDVILGMKWLKTLGDMKVNWKQLTMVF